MARLDDYTGWLLAHGGSHEGLRFAVDCSDGSAGILARRLFPDAVLLNDTPDGNFPHHSPNPLKAEAREQIAALKDRALKAAANAAERILAGEADVFPTEDACRFCPYTAVCRFDRQLGCRYRGVPKIRLEDLLKEGGDPE